MRPKIRCAAGAGVAVLLAIGLSQGEAQDEPRFEVASVRPVQAVSSTGVRVLPNGINAISTVRQLVLFAYDLRSYQVVGGPAWIPSNRFEISARAGGEVTPAVARQMLKNLLRDRFRLRAHIETRQADVHVLVVARDDGRLGPGLTRTTVECEGKIPARLSGDATQRDCDWVSWGSDRAGGLFYIMNGVVLERLVTRISLQDAAPVVDRTGLSGLFDIRLNYASPQFNAFDPTRDAGHPPFRVALEEQLGLRLLTQKGPLEVLVIDSVERPSEN